MHFYKLQRCISSLTGNRAHQQPPFLIFCSFSQSSSLPTSPPISLSPLHPLVLLPSESIFTCLWCRSIPFASALVSVLFRISLQKSNLLRHFRDPPAHPSTASQPFLCSVIDSLLRKSENPVSFVWIEQERLEALEGFGDFL